MTEYNATEKKLYFPISMYGADCDESVARMQPLDPIYEVLQKGRKKTRRCTSRPGWYSNLDPPESIYFFIFYSVIFPSSLVSWTFDSLDWGLS